MTPKGVGLVFVPRLLPFLQETPELVSVLEIEPQTLWKLSRVGGETTYQLNRERFDQIVAMPFGKLMHSVGLPLGSTAPLDKNQLPLLREMADTLQSPWISDHLSFNAFFDADRWSSGGFFLPPLQIPETVSVAAANLGALGESLERPIAFETGVNYLKARPGELPDGEFFAQVAKAADCGILLDLHNIWVNECNQRSMAADVLSSIPLERVWELHVAGGMELRGHRLDAHSGGVPEAVWELAFNWVPRMPNLGAIVFEILDEHVESIGITGVVAQLEMMHKLWALKAPATEIRISPSARQRSERGPDLRAVSEWETTLGSLAVGRALDSQLATSLNRDAGTSLFQELVSDARAGLISEGLRYSMSLLLGTIGPTEVKALLREFMSSRPPELFASAESDAFAQFLKTKPLTIEFFDEVLAFEHALIRATLYGTPSTVQLAHDPIELLTPLESGLQPMHPRRVNTTILIRPEA